MALLERRHRPSSGLALGGDPWATLPGALFTRVTTNPVSLGGSNTIPSAVRVTVNGENAAFVAGQAQWSQTHTLARGFNRLVVQALDAKGAVLAATNQDVVAELATSEVGGLLRLQTEWTPAMGIIRVTNQVIVPAGGAGV